LSQTHRIQTDIGKIQTLNIVNFIHIFTRNADLQRLAHLMLLRLH